MEKSEYEGELNEKAMHVDKNQRESELENSGRTESDEEHQRKREVENHCERSGVQNPCGGEKFSSESDEIQTEKRGLEPWKN